MAIPIINKAAMQNIIASITLKVPPICSSTFTIFLSANGCAIAAEKLYSNVNTVSFITGITVNETNKEKLFSDCKNYFLENYSYLGNISLFINNNIQADIKKKFIDLMNNISNGLSNIRPMNLY